ncbi:MAG: alpha/beta hydrolase [Acidobacteria bacterium]|nr:MAG: alpha/beta hydrolase [Acidobacteriota bacterium]
MHRDVPPWLLMPTSARRVAHAVLATVLMFSIGDVVLAQPAPAPTMADDQRLLPYIKPGQLIDIGGRRINLLCMGAGGPTVVLMAGSASWSPVWYKVQPVMAQTTRVCTFDRAGFGFSDPAPRFQILPNVVDDLHAALKSGAIPGPYVLVGHSLGGLEVRLYAQRWPQEVEGMVLVDTSPAGEGLIEQNQPGFDAAYGGVASNTTPLLNCAFLAVNGPLDPSRPEHKDCMPPLPSGTPAAFRKVFPQFFTAYYFADRVSLMSSLDTHQYDSVDHRSLGALPLVVLSPEITWEFSTPAEARVSPSYEKVWIAMHEALARLSSRGVHRFIKGSGHHIQLDKPQAVIDAVDEVLRERRVAAQS